MRIVQLLPTMSFGDAVSNDAAAIHRMIGEMGYEPEIYADNIDPRLQNGIVLPVKRMRPPEDGDVLICHGSTGDAVNYLIPRLRGKKLMRYHNITPPGFFRGYSTEAERRAENGYREMRRIAGCFSGGTADSDYNRQDMRRLGFRCPVDLCPIVIPWEDYGQEPDPDVMEKYGGDGVTNLLFVGRVAPNKRQENLIRAFYDYHWNYNPRSRLVLLGSAVGMEKYRAKLEAYTEQLGLTGSVLFTGQVSFRAMIAWYRLADLFACMSEHEGFCVPIAEAMHFGLPVVALRAAAVAETLGGAGLLLDSAEPGTAAAAFDRVLRDAGLKERFRAGREKQLDRFRYGRVKQQMEKSLLRLIR